MIGFGAKEIGDRAIRLREVIPADSPLLYRWRMDDSSRPMFRSTQPVSPEAHQAFLARYFQPGNTDRWFVIEAEGRAVGAICLYGISADRGDAEWGRLVVAPEHRGCGFGKRALALLIEHARAIGVRRLRCEVLAGNTAAESIYRRLGFEETGRDEAEGRVFRHLVLMLPR